MATLIEKTIGSTGDYPSWTEFIAACPTNLVTLDQQWTVKFQNQVHSSTGVYDFASTARTTSATCYFHFTSDTGAGWCDNAAVRSRAFKYDSTYGAAIVSSNSGITFAVNVSYTRISKLMFASTNTGSTAQPALRIQSTATNCDVDRCIASGYSRNTSIKGVVNIAGATSYFRNSLILQMGTDVAALIASFGTGVKAINVTCVSVNTKVNVGLDNGSAAVPVYKNVAVFNATIPEVTAVVSTKTTCFTDVATSGWTTVPYTTATFESVTAATPDFRLKTGSALIDAGTADSTYALYDATGTARSGATDGGAWEYATAPSPSATISWVEADTTFSINAQIPVQGQVSWVEADTTFNVTGTVGAPSVNAAVSWTEADATFSITGSVQAANGTLTTGTFKNNTGSVLSGLTNLTATVLSLPNLLFVKNFVLQSLNGSNQLALTDASLSVGSYYAVVVTNNAGTVLGVEKYQAT